MYGPTDLVPWNAPVAGSATEDNKWLVTPRPATDEDVTAATAAHLSGLDIDAADRRPTARENRGASFLDPYACVNTNTSRARRLTAELRAT